MSLPDRLRAAKRNQYAALARAGFNTRIVDFLLFVSETAPRHYAGQMGERHYVRLVLTPTPEVLLKSGLADSKYGLQADGDALLKGAFPLQLNGYEITINANGEETQGNAISKNYATPLDFRRDVEVAESFRIDGEAFAFRSVGPLQIDTMQSEWALRLIRK
jgi:hypothetical protein